MRYAFAINHHTCIGCHACTVACKTEHNVPVGSFRTWVKYTERGTFPSVRRYFSVLRCNHCTNAPCVAICPTGALFTRPDGIVDFNRDACIGCKACMQACPYDAIYIDPDTNTAAKCNFCAHRVESGLLPACVIVCPEQAIVAGDLDDPTSTISRLLAREPADVRKPEQGTGPNVYYLGADSASLTPTSIARGRAYLWGTAKTNGDAAEKADPAEHAAHGATPAPPSLGRVTYDVHHPSPWGFKVALYLWTKGIGAGALLLAALVWALGLARDRTVLGVEAGVVALLANGATVVLLVADLKRPERFLYLVTRGRWGSWLVRGAYVLLAHALAAAAWAVFAWRGDEAALGLLAWPAAAVAFLAAAYTAFLFGQAEGRDLWQSPLVFWHLVAQAVLAGGGVLLLVAVLAGGERAIAGTLAAALVAGLVLDGLVLVADLLLAPATREAAIGHRLLVRGRYAAPFWGIGIAAGLVAPLLLLLTARAWTGGAPAAGAIAALLVLVALLVREAVFVRAGQAVPLS